MFWRKNPEYWGRAGAGVLPLAKSSGRLLVPFRSLDVNEPHTWGTVGGKLDSIDEHYDDEDDYDDYESELEEPEVAALREFWEETCSSIEPKLIPLYIFEDEDFIYYNFLGLVPKEFTPCINWETERWEWLTIDELLKLEPKHYGLEMLLDDPASVREIMRHV